MHSNESMIQVCVNTVPGPVQSTKNNISYIHHHLPPGALHLRCHLLQGRLCLLSVDCYWTSDQRQPCQMITMLNEPKTISIWYYLWEIYGNLFKKIHLRISCINSIDANPIRHNLGRHSHLPESGLSTWQWLERWWRSLDLQWIAFQDFQTKAFC